MKKILIFSAKWPVSELEADGGIMTVSQLVKNLYGWYGIDYMYLKKDPEEKLHPIKEIKKRYEVDGSFLGYHTYNQENADKFLVRIENAYRISRYIIDVIDDYDAVIIVHCLQAFGLAESLSQKQLDKIILYPMFLSPSYQRAGDIVPEEYRKEEKKVLNAVGNIITPSETEMQDIVKYYSVDRSHIHVIPRGIPDNIISKIRCCYGDVIHLCCVGSFKNQKNHLETLKLAELLSEQFPIRLHIAGSIQDRGIYEICKTYIQEHHLQEIISIEHYKNTEMAEFYDKMDMAVSLSLFETFGRAVFEGMASGLPTFVLKANTTAAEYIQNCNGIVFCESYLDMAVQVARVLKDNLLYQQMSKAAAIAGMHFTNAVQKEKTLAVLETIIGKETYV